jgi:quercetin dioxygenase-like cupin family protein
VPAPDGGRLVTVRPGAGADVAALDWFDHDETTGVRTALLPAAPATVWAVLTFPPHTVLPEHATGQEQHLVVTAGAPVLTTPEGDVALATGDCLVLPGGLRHGWRTGPEAAALTVFAVAAGSGGLR